MARSRSPLGSRSRRTRTRAEGVTRSSNGGGEGAGDLDQERARERGYESPFDVGSNGQLPVIPGVRLFLCYSRHTCSGNAAGRRRFHAAGFSSTRCLRSTRIRRPENRVLLLLRRVSAAECYTWVESRNWPILESFHEAELQRGLCELRARYGSQRLVEFTSRFDLVLGTKPEALAS